MFVEVSGYGNGWLFYQDYRLSTVYMEEGSRIRVPSTKVSARRGETPAFGIKNAGEIFCIAQRESPKETILDIDLAWSIISASRTLYGFKSYDDMLNTFYRSGGKVDVEKINRLGYDSFDTSIPLLIGRWGHGDLIIDGNHRLYVAIATGVTIPYYRLSRDEMRLLKRSGTLYR